jgi:transposase
MATTLTEAKLIEIFVETDDFLLKLRAATGQSDTHWKSSFARSEVMAIQIAYHHSGRTCLKYFYQMDILGTYAGCFPKAPCYGRFVALLPHTVAELCLLAISRCGLPGREANFVDSKPIKACHIKREKQNRVFDGKARKGKSSVGWFYGFKLHAVVNHCGELVRFLLTPGNVSDNNQGLLRRLLRGIRYTVYGDRGYWSGIRGELLENGVFLRAKPKRKGRKDTLTTSRDVHYEKCRGIIETVFGVMCGFLDIEHTRHRSPVNFLCNLFAGLAAYTFLDKFPSIRIYQPEKGTKICLVAA